MWQRIKDGVRRFFSGRYGSDQLNHLLLILALIFLALGWLGAKLIAPWMSIFNLVAYVPLVWCIVRMYSRNFEARRHENVVYMRLLDRLKDKSHRYFRCPGCRQTVRVPRGKGKINIRCPKCGRQFIKKT